MIARYTIERRNDSWIVTRLQPDEMWFGAYDSRLKALVAIECDAVLFETWTIEYSEKFKIQREAMVL
jgi:hypothetical protein